MTDTATDWDRHFLTEPSIAKLTEAAVADALSGFQFAPQKGMSWIARAVQGALYITVKDRSDSPDRQSNAVTRKELLALAKRASDTWAAIFNRSEAADSALMNVNLQAHIGPDVVPITPPVESLGGYREFSNALAQLDWLAQYLRAAADGLEPQSGKWCKAEAREQRIDRAHALSPIYERAFGREATVTTHPQTGAISGGWPDFYRRIVALAFDEDHTPDLEAVLDAARRRHLSDPVDFKAPGLIPD